MLILKVTFLGDTHHFQLRQDTTIPYLKESVMNKFRLPPIAFDLTYCDKEGDEVSLVGNNDLEILREDQRQIIDVHIEIEQPEMECPLSNLYLEDIDETKILYNQIQKVEMVPKVNLERDSLKIMKVEVPQGQPGKNDFDAMILRDGWEIISGNEDQMSTKAQQGDCQVSHPAKCNNCHQDPIIGIRYQCALCEDYDLCQKCEAKGVHLHPMLKIKELMHTPVSIKLSFEKSELPKVKTEVNRKDMSVQQIKMASHIEYVLQVDENSSAEFVMRAKPISNEEAVEQYLKQKITGNKEEQINKQTLLKTWTNGLWQSLKNMISTQTNPNPHDSYTGLG